MRPIACARLMKAAPAGPTVPPAWDPATVGTPLSLAVSNQQLILAASNSSIRKTARALTPITGGKWYWEFAISHVYGGGNATTTGLGLCDSGFSYSSLILADDSTANAGGIWPSGNMYFSGSPTVTGIGVQDGDTVMVALDATTGKLWFGKNGNWGYGHDPASGTGPHYTGLNPALTYYPAATPWSSDGTAVRFDIRGATNSTYPAPSGFTPYGT